MTRPLPRKVTICPRNENNKELSLHTCSATVNSCNCSYMIWSGNISKTMIWSWQTLASLQLATTQWDSFTPKDESCPSVRCAWPRSGEGQFSDTFEYILTDIPELASLPLACPEWLSSTGTWGTNWPWMTSCCWKATVLSSSHSEILPYWRHPWESPQDSLVPESCHEHYLLVNDWWQYQGLCKEIPGLFTVDTLTSAEPLGPQKPMADGRFWLPISDHFGNYPFPVQGKVTCGTHCDYHYIDYMFEVSCRHPVK